MYKPSLDPVYTPILNLPVESAEVMISRNNSSRLVQRPNPSCASSHGWDEMDVRHCVTIEDDSHLIGFGTPFRIRNYLHRSHQSCLSSDWKTVLFLRTKKKTPPINSRINRGTPASFHV